MSDQKQYAEDILGPPEQYKQKYAEDILGPRPLYEGNLKGGAWNAWFEDQLMGPGRLMTKFNQAYDRAFGEEPLGLDRVMVGGKSITQHARDVGLFPAAQEAQTNIYKQFNESLMRGSVGLADYALRGAYATARGLAATADSPAGLGQVLGPAGAVASSLFEAFPAGHYTGLPVKIPGSDIHTGTIDSILDLAESNSPHQSLRRTTEALAADQESSGRGPNREVLQQVPAPPDPIQLQRDLLQNTVTEKMAEASRLRELGRPFEAPGAVTRLEAEARRAQEQLDALPGREPEQFPRQEAVTTLDDLTEERRTLQSWLDSNTGVPQRLRVGGVEIPGNVPFNEAALEMALEQEAPTGQRSAQEALEKQIRAHLADLDKRIADLTPKAAEERRGQPSVTYEFARPQYADVGLPPAGEVPLPEGIRPNPGGGFDIDTTQGTFYAATASEATKISVKYDILKQRRPTIAQEVYRELKDAGRPDAESRAGAALVQAHYIARAARFEGALGTARELYDADAPSIQAARGRDRGMLSLSENIVRLFRDADASTFMHETAHGWFEEFLNDAKHPNAPVDLKSDLETVRQWLGMTGDRPTRAQHEKFARGFERYLMEGVAPDPKLANIFTKFATWLRDLYQTVSRLRAPITDDIRGVYDRLLKNPKTEVFLEPERPGRPDFANEHEALARNSEDPLKTAEVISAERNDIASVLRDEIQSGRQRARAAARTTTSGAESGDTVPTRASGGVRSESEGTASAAGNATERPSGASVEIEKPVVTDPNQPATRSGGRFVDRAGNIRLDNLNTTEDVEAAIRSAADYNNGYGQERRGVVSDAQILDLATRLGTDPAFLDRKAIGEAFNAEEVVAARLLLRQSEVNVRQAMKDVNEGGDPLELAKAIARAEMIQGKVAQATAEAGRAMRAFRLLSELGPESELSVFLKENRGDIGRTYDQLLQLARHGEFMTGDGQINNFVRVTHGARFPILYYYLNSLLSGPITHSVYAIGNELRAVSNPIYAAYGAVIGDIRAINATLRGRETPTDRVYWSEVMASVYGFGKGSLEGWRAAKEAFATGQQVTLPGMPGFSANMPPAATGIGTGVGRIVGGLREGNIREAGRGVIQAYGLPYRSVASIHSYGATLHYYQNLYRAATRTALMENLSGEALRVRTAELSRNPPAEMMERAFARGGDLFEEVPQGVRDWQKIAEKASEQAMASMYMRVYDYHSPIATTIRGLHSNPYTAMLVPFIKVGVEIQRENFIRHTPLGFLEKQTRGELVGREGGAAFDEAQARLAIGASLIGGGALLSALGWMDDLGPSDNAEHAVWEMAGHQSHSLRIGDGFRIPLRGIPVLGSLLMFGADMYGAAALHWNKPEYSQLFKNYLHAFAHAAFDEGFFRDLGDIGSMVREPDRYMHNWLLNWVPNWMPWAIGMGQVNRFGFDPYSKDVHGFDVTAILDSFRRQIPGSSYGVPNRLDVFGNPIPSRASWTAHFAEYKNDPVVKMLDRIHVGIAKPDRNIEGVELTTREYEHFSSVAGKLLYKFLQPYAGEEFGRLPEGIQRVMVHEAVLKAHEIARQQIKAESIHENPVDNLVMKAYQKKLEVFKN